MDHSDHSDHGIGTAGHPPLGASRTPPLRALSDPSALLSPPLHRRGQHHPASPSTTEHHRQPAAVPSIPLSIMAHRRGEDAWDGGVRWRSTAAPDPPHSTTVHDRHSLSGCCTVGRCRYESPVLDAGRLDGWIAGWPPGDLLYWIRYYRKERHEHRLSVLLPSLPAPPAAEVDALVRDRARPEKKHFLAGPGKTITTTITAPPSPPALVLPLSLPLSLSISPAPAIGKDISLYLSLSLSSSLILCPQTTYASLYHQTDMAIC